MKGSQLLRVKKKKIVIITLKSKNVLEIDRKENILTAAFFSAFSLQKLKFPGLITRDRETVEQPGISGSQSLFRISDGFTGKV